MDGCRIESQRVDVEHVLVADHGDGLRAFAEPVRKSCEQSPPDLDLQRCEQDVFGVPHKSCRHRFVERLPLVEQSPELILVLRKRTAGVAGPPPCVGHVDDDPKSERIVQEQLTRPLGEHRPTPKGDDRGRR